MKELFRNDDLVAVEIPSHTRTLLFEDGTARLELPKLLVTVSLTQLTVNTPLHEDCYVPLALPNCGNGFVCLGDDLDQPETLEDALTYYLDEFYSRQFEGETVSEIRPNLRIPQNLRDILFWHAYESTIDARPFREHKYLVPRTNLYWEGNPLTDEIPELREKLYAVFPSIKHAPAYRDNVYNPHEQTVQNVKELVRYDRITKRFEFYTPPDVR